MNRTIEAVLRVSAKTGNLQPLWKVQDGLSRVYGQAEQFNRRQSAMRHMQRAYWGEAAMLASRFAGPVALGAVGIAMGKAASNMEDALFRIQKKTGATEAEMSRLRGEIKDLARDVPVSMDEIAAAFERGGAAGIPLDQLREFAELTVKVADSWDMTAESVANAFVGFEAGMGIPRDQLEDFADLINYLADSGIADESGIVDFIDRAGASLKNFGLQKEEIAAYGAAMLNLKIPAEVAARAMDTLTGKLIAPSNLSPKARGALKEVVGDLDQYAKLIEKDAGGAMDLFWDKLQKFRSADRARVLGGLLGEGFDDEVMRLSAGVEELNRNLDATQKKSEYLGSISESSAKKMELWSSQVEVLSNNMTGLADTFGAPLLDKVNAGLTGVNEFFDAQADMSAGRSKATALGETETQVFEEYRRRYESAYGDKGGPGLGESYRRDLQALGSGDIKSLYERLGDVERERGRGDKELAAARSFEGFDTREQAIREAADPMPTPTPRPVALSEAEQRALYGKGQAYQFWADADRRMRTNDIVENMNRGVVNPAADLEARLEAASKLPIDPEGPGDWTGIKDAIVAGGSIVGKDLMRPIGESSDRMQDRARTAHGDDGAGFAAILSGVERLIEAARPPPSVDVLPPMVDAAAPPADRMVVPALATPSGAEAALLPIADRARAAQDIDAGVFDRMLEGLDKLGPAGEQAGRAVEDGGTAAGQAILEAGSSGGERFGEAAKVGISSGGADIAALIRQAIEQGATSAAASIRAALAQGVKVNVSAPSGPPRVNADVGRSGGDVIQPAQ